MSLLFNLIRKLEKESVLSRKEIVERLQNFHCSFEFLDEITFCRWANGVTTPNFYKQLLLISFFSFPLVNFIEMIDYKIVPKKNRILYDKILDLFNCYYHSVSCYEPITSKTITLNYSLLTVSEHWNIFSGFYENVKSKNNIRFMNDTINSKVKTYVFSIKNKECILSHTSCIFEANYFLDYLNLSIDDDSDKSVLINVSYYANSKFFEILIGNILMHIQNKVPDVQSLYILFRGGQFLNFIESSGGKVVWKEKGNTLIGRAYLIKVEWAEFVSNPIVFNLVKAQLKNYGIVSKLGSIDLDVLW